MTQSKKFMTPFGTASWPRLNTPDRQFNPDGEYKVDLVLDPEEEGVNDFVEAFRAYEATCYADLCKEKGKKSLKKAASPLKEQLDDEDEPTGKFILRVKMKAKVTPKNGEAFTQRPKLFDANSQPMAEEIGGGSRIRVNLESVPFWTGTVGAGVTNRLKGVQVIELVEPGGSGSMGFAAVAGGFASTKKEADPVVEEAFDAAHNADY